MAQEDGADAARKAAARRSAMPLCALIGWPAPRVLDGLRRSRAMSRNTSSIVRAAIAGDAAPTGAPRSTIVPARIITHVVAQPLDLAHVVGGEQDGGAAARAVAPPGSRAPSRPCRDRARRSARPAAAAGARSAAPWPARPASAGRRTGRRWGGRGTPRDRVSPASSRIRRLGSRDAVELAVDPAGSPRPSAAAADRRRARRSSSGRAPGGARATMSSRAPARSRTVGSSRPRRIESVVVLPAPLPPSRAERRARPGREADRIERRDGAVAFRHAVDDDDRRWAVRLVLHRCGRTWRGRNCGICLMCRPCRPGATAAVPASSPRSFASCSPRREGIIYGSGDDDPVESGWRARGAVSGRHAVSTWSATSTAATTF